MRRDIQIVIAFLVRTVVVSVRMESRMLISICLIFSMASSSVRP